MKATVRRAVFIGGIFFFCFYLNSAAEVLTPDSKITEVTVYPGAARITREAQMDLAKGTHSVVFKDVIPQLDESSLSVAGQGKADVKIFGAYIKREYLTEASDKRVQDLQDKIEALDDQINVRNNDLQVLQQEEEFLNSVKLYSGQQIPKDLVTKTPAVTDLGDILKFLSTGFTDNQNKREEIRLKLRELQRDREKLQRELAELNNGGTREQRVIVVDLECLTAGGFSLDVSYLLNGATWRPLYDARADYEKGEVELTSYGVIQQTTGEDWQDVRLTLSTAQPSLGGRMPYIAPWILEAYQPQSNDRALARGVVATGMMKTMQYAAMDAAAPESSAVMKDKKAEMQYSQVAQKGISVVYQIARPAVVKADGAEYKFPITTQMLKADYEYSSFPQAAAYAYLGSRVKNAPDLQLLAGQVNLFLAGDYVGKSSIDNVGPAEEFDLYLGVDESVKVERKEISKKVDDVLIAGIPSPNRKTTFSYRLTVENYKNRRIKVNLFEAMPVSQNDRIKVKVSDVSVKPQDQDWKDRKGIWRWEFELAPQEKKEIYYSFSVETPRDMQLLGI